jgi:hypothetical protein
LLAKDPNGHPSSPIFVTSLENESAASGHCLRRLLTPQPGSEQLFGSRTHVGNLLAAPVNALDDSTHEVKGERRIF